MILMRKKGVLTALLLLLICLPLMVFAESAQVQDITVPNRPVKGVIRIEKQGPVLTGFNEHQDPFGYPVHTPLYSDGELEGATFEIRAVADIVGQARTVRGLGVGGPGLGVGQGVVIVVRVLLRVLDGEAHLSRLVGDGFRDIGVDGADIQLHCRLVRLIAHHGGAGHGVVVVRPPGESRRPGRRCLRAVCKDVVDDDRVGVFLFAFGKRWQGHQRQGHDQRQHECQRPFPCFHFLIPPISFILGAGRPQLTWVLQGQF